MKQFTSFILILSGLVLYAGKASSQSSMKMLYVEDSAMSFSRAVDSIKKQIILEDGMDTSEGGRLNNFTRWARKAEERISLNAPAGANRLTAGGIALDNYLINASTYCTGTEWKGNWKNLGPFLNTYSNGPERSGRINAVWIHPADTNIILAGSASGGLWKTDNAGITWRNITDASSSVISGTAGIQHIAVNPTNFNIIYIASNKHGLNKNTWGYTSGLIYSTDGGQSWQHDLNANTVIAQQGSVWDESVSQLSYIHGTSQLLAVYKNAVYLKTAPGSNWQNITPAWPSGSKVTSLDFTKSAPVKAIFKLAPDGTGISYLYSYDQLGTWTTHLADFNTSVNYQIAADWENISVSNAGNVYFNIVTTTGRKLVRYAPATGVYSVLNSNLPEMEFVRVSPANETVFYGARSTGWQSNDLLLSTNSGSTFTHSVVAQNTHADARFLQIYSSGNAADGTQDRVYAGTDGGIVCKRPGDDRFRSITGDGLCISQIYGFSGSDGDDNILEGGAQDNGNNIYIKTRTPQWSADMAGDAYLSRFARNGVRTVYTQFNFPHMRGFSFNNNTVSNIFLTHPEDGLIDADHDGVVEAGEYIPLWHEHAQDTRPLYFDPNNIAYAGYYHLWRKSLTDPTWTWALDPDPKLPTATDSLFDQRMIRDYILSEKDPNVAYLAYKRPAFTDPTGSGNPSGRLYRITNLIPQAYPNSHIANNNWINITPPIVKFHRIMDIEIDPEHPNRIWVALGEVDWNQINTTPGQIQNRVKYSDDYGQTWQDVSHGLSALPVNKIVYQQGTDDVLFAGTDVGVFKWEKSLNEWVCYSNNLPSCIVSDMEINYCSGKLKISTLGRGIWETNILVDPYPANNPPTYQDQFRPIPQETISTNTIWNSDKYITTGIKVTNGATLTIQNNGSDTTVIHMPKLGVIFIEKGATLVVDGARITNSCEECMWAGISVQGTNHAPQTLTYQGKITLKNGAVIEHAMVALSNSYIDDPNRGNNTGGILQATNTTFLNNGRAAEFISYSGNALNDVSFFRNCRFEINDRYKGAAVGYHFAQHVTMWDIHGVEFNGCTFVNNHTTSQKNKGDGIYTYNASFYARPYILGGNQPGNRFDSLKHGIVVDGDMYGWPLSPIIDRNSFSANSVGLKILNLPNVAAIRNTFTVGNGKGIDAFDCKDNIGIHAKNTPLFRIEENTFNGATGAAKIADNSVGTLVDNSGINDKEIYKNSYTNLDIGVFAQGKNTSYIGKQPSDQTGLRVICNTFTTNDRDINITGDPLKKEGICYMQGYYKVIAGVGKVVSAGNSFMTSTATHIHNTASNFNYFHYNSVSLPSNITGTVAVHLADVANECASRLSTVTEPDRPVELTNDMKSALKTLFWNSKSSRDSRQSTWEGLINGGYTEQEILDEVSLRTDVDAMNYLLSYAPYLSSGVLNEVATMGIMNNDLLKEVLIANPDLIRDMDVRSHISSDNVPTPFDEPAMEELYDYIQDETPRTRLEAEISFHQANMSEAVNLLLTDIKCKDEVTEEDSILVWLNRTDELWADYQKAYYWLSKGQPVTALDIIEDQIPVDYVLTDDQATENTALKDIATILPSVNSSAEITQLLAILNAGMPNASSLASSLLTLAGVHTVPCFEVVATASRQAVTVKNGSIRKRPAGLNVYPNPANEYVIFEYRLEKDAAPILVTITNSVGQEVGRFELKSNATGKHYWDIRHLPAGTYFYTAGSRSKQYGSDKIVVVR